MTGSAIVAAVAALAAGGQGQVSGGATPPERTTHRYEVVCGGRTGGLVVEERFSRTAPASTVWITSQTPLGSATPRSVDAAVARAAARMARIERVTWLCDGRRAVLFISYLDREAYERSVKDDTPLPEEKERTRRATFILDAAGLKLDAPPMSASSSPPAARPGTIVADIDMSEWALPKRLALDVRTGAYSVGTFPDDDGRGMPGATTARDGVLAPEAVRRVRAAHAATLAEGLERPECAGGARGEVEVVISTAGTPALSVAGDRGPLSAPGELGCWTPAARTLHRTLENSFAPVLR